MGDRRWVVAATVVIAAAATAIAPAGPVWAQGVTGTELAELASEAADDPRALARLRAVREVDGQPADVARALAGAEGPSLSSRLKSIESPTAGPPPVTGPAARRAAAEVLDGSRFKPARVPRPFAGVLRTLGRWLDPVRQPIARLWNRVTGSVAGQLALVGLVFAGAALVALRLVGRRSPGGIHPSWPLGTGAGTLDPDLLERDADAAALAGDLDRAVRLRFVAGVVRLDRAGAVSYSSSLTSGQLRARLDSGAFAELADAFDEIAYGGRSAEESDVRAATEVWPRVLAEARR